MLAVACELARLVLERIAQGAKQALHAIARLLHQVVGLCGKVFEDTGGLFRRHGRLGSRDGGLESREIRRVKSGVLSGEVRQVRGKLRMEKVSLFQHFRDRLVKNEFYSVREC